MPEEQQKLLLPPPLLSISGWGWWEGRGLDIAESPCTCQCFPLSQTESCENLFCGNHGAMMSCEEINEMFEELTPGLGSFPWK